MNSGPLGIFRILFHARLLFERAFFGHFSMHVRYMFFAYSLHMPMHRIPRATLRVYTLSIPPFQHPFVHMASNNPTTLSSHYCDPPKSSSRSHSFIHSFTIPITPDPTPEKGLVIPQSKLRPIVRQLVITPISPPN